MAIARILLVDDNETVRRTLSRVLQMQDFEVTTAAGVVEALQFINSQPFDALLTDLHMPGAGDGLTVVSAMRHKNPQAVTFLLSAFPEMSVAANAILMQTDEILVKPMDIVDLVDVIKQRLAKGPLHRRKVETLATILARTSAEIIDDWYDGVERDTEINVLPLSREARCHHLPHLLRDLTRRLQTWEPLGTKEMRSESAANHGLMRRQQGYTAGMVVEESRILQVSIFRTLQANLGTIDFSVLLLGVMTIADEVDSQLSQTMKAYIAELAQGIATA